ncbi:MAG: hypothetical protein ACLGGW_07195, partial [Gammaproteobacteria bacterium]
QFLLFLYGSGANGKSVFIRILQTLLGDYGVNVAPETLEVKNTGGGGATEDLARLKGKRAAFTTETNTKCQRRLNFDPLCFVNAKVNLTHPSNSF